MNLPNEKEASKAPTETVIGWLLIFFSFLVTTLGINNGQINAVFWVGIGIVPIGIICIIIGRQKQKKTEGLLNR